MLILYLKTHLVTLKKYLGVTTQEIDYYSGSGSAWKEHLKEYGSTKVKTEILFESDDENEFSKFCIETSKFLNVVESEEYLNAREETGINFWYGGLENGYKKSEYPVDNKDISYVPSYQSNGKVALVRRDSPKPVREDVVLNPEMCVDVLSVLNKEDESAGQFDYSELSAMRDVIAEMLESLTPREKKIIKLRFGIGMRTDYSLEEVAQMEDVNSERIRQIEAKALRKLRHPTRSKKLRTFLSPDTVINIEFNENEFIPPKTLQMMRGIELSEFFSS